MACVCCCRRETRAETAPLPANVEYSNLMGRLLKLLCGTYHVQTLGGRMNRVDSEGMDGELEGMPRCCRPVLGNCALDHAEQNVYRIMGRHVQRNRAAWAPRGCAVRPWFSWQQQI
jgi:hypothetical protein